MPPKRKAAPKATEVVENGAEKAEPPKAKRGKAAKPVEEPEETVTQVKTTRSTRAKAAQGEKEKVVVEEEPPKTKGAKPKNVKEEKKEPKAKKEAKEKASTAKAKGDTKAKSDTKSTKTKATKKKNDESEDEKPTTSRKKPAAKKVTTRKEKPKETKGDEALLNKVDTDYSTIDFTCNAKNAAGELPNFKISSWNVDGLRAWYKKNGTEYIKMELPDILCLQETKCTKDDIPDELNKFMDYKAYWLSSDKDGYAGVALFTKIDPVSVEYGIKDENFDDEGRCITAEYEKFYVVNVYVPNAGRNLVTLDKRLAWNEIFKEYIANLDKTKPVIVCGDMNVAHNEIDLTNPKTNKKNAGFTQEERDGMTQFLEDRYVDTFRHLYPETTDAYTFWSYMKKARAKNIGWRLDYFIISKRFIGNICDHVIRSEVYGSDHCPITLYLNI